MISIRKIGVIRRGYRHLNRYRQIVGTLIKYGFGGVVDALSLEQYLEMGREFFRREPREKVEHYSRAERTRMAIEELGPTFIKLGQILSTRPDLIPAEFVDEFEKLQDHVAPFEFGEVRRIVEEELGRPIESVFQSFLEEPLAAASIGQVHRAKLKEGADVVVKVQRPGIRQIIEVDLEIMLHLASVMERHLEEVQAHRPTRIVAEFARAIEREIDYSLEASYMERFYGQFDGNTCIYVPKVYREASTERVLTTEYVDGIKASELDAIDKAGLDRKVITARGADLIFKQMFQFGFFHADPHPGNILVLPDNVICYLDYGLMGHLTRQTREDCVELLYALGRKDESMTVRALLKLVEYDESPARQPLERDVADFMARHVYRPLKEMEMGKLFRGLFGLLSEHRLRIPHDLSLMLKALTTWEGVGRSLDPDFSVMEKAAPLVENVRTARMHPERIAGDLLESGIDLVRVAGDIPHALRDVLIQLKQGNIKIDLQHRDLDMLSKSRDRAGKRVALSILIAALIVGSALIVLSEAPPSILGIPVVAFIGFVAAAVMAVWLLIRL
jgi:ubiquinone biosynthesis protein